MITQDQITEKHRLKLIDWIINVNENFSLLEETLFLTINIIDRYLSKVDLSLQKFHLLGVASMFIASKYQEIYAPELRDFVLVTGNNCKKEDILQMECDILKKLNFDMLIVSPLIFYNRMYFISANANKNEIQSTRYHRLYFIGLFVLELSLLEYKMIKYSPSVIASAGLLIARKLSEISPYWPKSILSGQGFNDVKSVNECAFDMISLIKKERVSNLISLRRKFSKESYLKVYSMFGTNCGLNNKSVNAS